VVLYQQGKIRLMHSVNDTRWRLPEGAVVVKDGTPERAAERLMNEQFKLHIVVRGVLGVTFDDVGDRLGQSTTYVFAVCYSEVTDPLPGLQLNAHNLKRIEAMNEKEVARDVMDMVRKAQAFEAQEKR
jgi:ADP-ribose pyrophosphatase YjhB (NUDIX family)